MLRGKLSDDIMVGWFRIRYELINNISILKYKIT